MSVITDIANAVVTELNAQAATLLDGGFTAQRSHRPQYDLAELKTLRVTVVPKGLGIDAAGRKINQHDYQIDLAVQKRLKKDQEPPETDALLTLVEKVSDLFRLRRLESYPDAVWVKTENYPLYSPDHLEQYGVFTSVLTLTYRVMR